VEFESAVLVLIVCDKVYGKISLRRGDRGQHVTTVTTHAAVLYSPSVKQLNIVTETPRGHAETRLRLMKHTF